MEIVLPGSQAKDLCHTMKSHSVANSGTELSDSIAHKLDAHRSNEHTGDFGQDQRLCAKKRSTSAGLVRVPCRFHMPDSASS